MTNKVRVFGKAQNRTALGIVNAYLVMYPHATFADFEKAFPKELNPDSGWPVNFKRLEECQTDNEKGFWFIEEDEVLHLADGTKMVICKMWTKPSFDRIVAHAHQYGIEVAEFERTMKGERGGFRLEYLNGYVPPAPAKKKGIPVWIWAAIAATVIGIGAAAYLMGNSGKTVVEEKVVVVRDTVYTERLEELETNFNAAKFTQGKADLNDDAKFVLYDLAKLLKKHPEMKLKIEGHTSAEGDEATNQQLSEARAKATFDFLVAQGVEEARLSFEGLGSSKLKNTHSPTAEENRRTEFIVIQ